jgi:hypothetical protein
VLVDQRHAHPRRRTGQQHFQGVRFATSTHQSAERRASAVADSGCDDLVRSTRPPGRWARSASTW